MEIWNLNIKSKASGKCFLKWTFFFFENFWAPTFWILQKMYELCKSCRNNSVQTLEWFLSTGKPCICEYGFHIGTLFPCPLFRRFFNTAILSRFLNVAKMTSDLMNKVYNGGFAPEFRYFYVKRNHRVGSRLCRWS